MMNKHNCRKPRRSGFSLLELLAVVTILGVIAAVVVPRISTSKVGAQREVHKQNISEINSAVERFYFDTGAFPKSDLSNMGIDYFPDGLPVNPLNPEKPYQLDTKIHRVINTEL